MKYRETRIRIGSLSIEGQTFDEALFRRVLAERIGEAREHREAVELAVEQAARAASRGGHQ